MITDHLPILLIIIGFFGAFFTPIIGMIRKKLCSPWATFITMMQFLISLLLLYNVVAAGNLSYWLGGWQPPWGIEYAVDILNAFVLVIVAGVCFLVSIYSRKSLGLEVPGKEIPLYTLYIVLSTGMLGIVITGDVFNLYVFLEISSLAAYALIALGDRQSGMASFNYMIMGTISASFILLGIGYLYVMTGTLNMADLSILLPGIYGRPVLLVAIALIVVGLSIKTALYPLHTWLPDAYTHAPSAISALLAGTFTKVGIYALIRVMFTVISPSYVIETVPVMSMLTWLAAIGILAGSVLAIAQYDIKRMLAYSSVSQIGYIILGVGLANNIAMTGGILHILSHSLMKTGLFMVSGAIIYRTGIKNIYQLKGMGKKMPYTMGAFVVGALSMIGIPPTVGFASKFYLAWGALEAGKWVFVIVILLSSLLTAVYFWRIFENVYFGVHETEEIKKDEAPLSMLIPIVIFAILVFLAGIFASIPIEVIKIWVIGVLP